MPAADAAPLPGPRGRRLRNLVRRFTDYPAFLQDLHREYGRIACFRTPMGNVCVVFDGDLIKEALGRESDDADTALLQGFSATQVPSVPHGATPTNIGEEHRWRSAALSAILTADHADEMTDVVVEHVHAFHDSWRAGQIIEVRPQLARMVANLMTELAFGSDMSPGGAIAERLHRAIKLDFIRRNLPLSRVVKVPLPPSLRAEDLFEQFSDLVERAVKRAEDPLHEGRDLVSRFVRARNIDDGERSFTNAELRDELLIGVLGASVGTLTTALTFAVNFLAWNPAVREALAREADDVLATRRATADDYVKLSYAQATWKEALRFGSPYFLDRRAARDFVLGGYLIPEGTGIQTCSVLLMQDMENFEEPRGFRPERWLGDNDGNEASPNYCPFGHGLRICKGRELAARIGVHFLAALGQRWRLAPTARRPPGTTFGIFGPYRLKDRLRVEVVKRSRNPAGNV